MSNKELIRDAAAALDDVRAGMDEALAGGEDE